MTWLMDNAPHLALLGFFISFIVIAVWAYWPANKSKLQERAQIPFKE
ncbi:MAG: CcoQ/FixQ family Cbb3-type cytochrome c oxidase assembly chaperone [Alphaproteobacteria bacterium]|nr:CcoQ/FixQ family Cbb3-type cytochrome c oxidase assembly chaperone [Alphaproteobacteria bacterium]